MLGSTQRSPLALRAFRRFCCGVVALAAVSSASGPAKAQTAPSATATNNAFSSVVVFGDSLSDPGNLADTLPMLREGTKFTTNPDPVWADILMEAFGAGQGRLAVGGSNYAYGGSCVLDATDPGVPEECPGETGPPSIKRQLDMYLGSKGGQADPDALHVVWGGANDIDALVEPLIKEFKPLIANPALFTPEAATRFRRRINEISSDTKMVAEATASQIQRLQDAGAEYILVLNLPDLSKTPYVQNFKNETITQAATNLIEVYNQTLAQQIGSRPDGIVAVNVNRLMDEVFADPQAYGFTRVGLERGPYPFACGDFKVNPAQPDGGGESLVCGHRGSGYPVIVNENEQYFWADSVHGTGMAQRLVANAAIATLDAPVQISMAGEGGVAMATAHREAISSERLLNTGSTAARASGWKAYVSGSIGKENLKPSDVLRLGTTAANLRVLTVGADYVTPGAIDWGTAFSIGSHDNEVTGANLDSTGVLGSVYGTWHHQGMALSGSLTAGRTSVSTQRSIQLGALERHHKGSTNVAQFGADVELTVFPRGKDNRQHQLTLGLGWLNQGVEGFSENDGLSTAMTFADFDRNSLVARIGYQLTVDIGTAVQGYGRIGYEKELLDDAVEVTAGSRTMPGTFTREGFVPSNQWVSISTGIVAALGGDSNAFIGYTGRFGDQDREDHQLNLGVGLAF